MKVWSGKKMKKMTTTTTTPKRSFRRRDECDTRVFCDDELRARVEAEGGSKKIFVYSSTVSHVIILRVKIWTNPHLKKEPHTLAQTHHTTPHPYFLSEVSGAAPKTP